MSTGEIEIAGTGPRFGARFPSWARALCTKRTLSMLGAAVIALVLVGAWLTSRASHIYVNDSRIAAHVIAVSSEVSGKVTAIPVLPGDRVSRGDLLAAVDTSEATLQLRELDARIAGIDAEQEQLRAQQEMVRHQLHSRAQAARSQLAAAQAELRQREAELQTARAEYRRLSSLFENHAVSAQRLEQTRAQYIGAEQQKLRAEAAVRAARANIDEVEAQREQILVLDRQIAALESSKAALVAQRDRQRIDLEKREIRAAMDGVVDQTFVDMGEYVSPGARLLMYHDPNDIWVDANIKETDFGRLKLGAPATITVDAYPGREFKGKVTRIGHAATSQFALLPNPNPSGNFTKVTQRLPVRISVEQQEDLLRPGMMVEVQIDVID
ncbi:MAG TPA: HlyD family secretion protein [Steroidobacter sp.]